MNRSFFLKLSISILIFVVIFYKLDINFVKIISVYKNFWPILLALLFPLFINQLIVNNRWRILLQSLGINEKTWTLIKISNSSAFIGLVLPSSQGYDAVRMYKIEKKYPNNRGIGCSVIIERLIGLICLCSIGIVSSFFINIDSVRYLIFIFSAVIFVIIFAIFNDWCFKRINGILSSVKKIKKLFNYLVILHEATYTFPFKKNIVSTLFLVLLLQINNTVIVYLLFRAAGVDIPFVYHLTAMPIINIISMIPLTISGLGIRDGAFVFMYSLIGVPNEIIIGVSILNYIIVTLLPASIGGVFYLHESFNKSKK